MWRWRFGSRAAAWPRLGGLYGRSLPRNSAERSFPMLSELWPSDAQPQVRAIHDVDGWLDAIAAGQCILRWVRAAVPRVGEPVFRVGVSQCGGPGWAVAPVLV